MKKLLHSGFILVIGILLILVTSAHGQWITQSFPLKAGWNAVYLHVDATYANLQELVSADANNPIQEIWQWIPVTSSGQYITSPQLPTGSGNPWASWVRSLGASSVLQRLTANAAYLIRVKPDITTNYTWNIKGRPVPVRYQWTTSGLNFLGFPTIADNPPSFESFLAPTPEMQLNAQIFQYVGGDLGVNNPIRQYDQRNTLARRGEGYWIRSGSTFNRYFGPIELDLQDVAGVDFRDSLSQYRIRLRNLASTSLTITVKMIDSELPPTGQTNIVSAPPLLLRGELNTTNLTYSYYRLTTTTRTYVLTAKGQVGSEAELILGVNRTLMTASTGSLYAGILQFTDSLNLTRLDVPVTAKVASKSGLWIGQAAVNQVRHYLKNYVKQPSGEMEIGSDGKYIVSSVNTNLGSVARPYTLRLILHTDSTGANTVMLQRVYCGVGIGGNQILATQENLLNPQSLNVARRISASHLPWSQNNTPWTCTGQLGVGTALLATIICNYADDASNPFLHTYHPDHDNRNSQFDAVLTQGSESYGLSRTITLSATSPADDFDSLTIGSQQLVGNYDESITIMGKGSASRRFDVHGGFLLNRVSDIATLTMP